MSYDQLRNLPDGMLTKVEVGILLDRIFALEAMAERDADTPSCALCGTAFEGSVVAPDGTESCDRCGGTPGAVGAMTVQECPTCGAVGGVITGAGREWMRRALAAERSQVARSDLLEQWGRMNQTLATVDPEGRITAGEAIAALSEASAEQDDAALVLVAQARRASDLLESLIDGSPDAAVVKRVLRFVLYDENLAGLGPPLSDRFLRARGEAPVPVEADE